MALRFEGGVVLAADTRTTTGVFVANRATDKLTPLHDKIYCCRSGSAADTQALADIVRSQLESHAVQIERAPSVLTAATLFQGLCYQYKEQLLAGIIVAGYDEIRGGVVYNIPLGGALVEADYAVGGSGSTYLYGFLDSNYRKGMSEEECVKFARHCVSLALYRDGASGGNVRTLVIKADGIRREFLQHDKLPFPVPSEDEEIL